MIVPTHLQIETINGVCTARCIMCPMPTWTRKPRLMNEEMFLNILQKFLPYRGQIEYLSLFGCGEPLLDPGFAKKVTIAKALGFQGVGTATNCTNLFPLMAQDILRAGMDTLICGVDGLTKEVHESIRVGTDFDKVLENIMNFMEMRPYYGTTKVIIRFIRQKANIHEWEEFKEFWESILNPAYGDTVVAYDVVDYDGKVARYDELTTLDGVDVPRECGEISNRLTIFSDGGIQLCCADHNGKFDLGNVLKDDPIEVYNTGLFKQYREMIAAGKIGDLILCDTCTIPRSQHRKEQA